MKPIPPLARHFIFQLPKRHPGPAAPPPKVQPNEGPSGLGPKLYRDWQASVQAMREAFGHPKA